MGWLPPSCVPYHYFEYNSSPRERGKLQAPGRAQRRAGLIPAWAGKTDIPSHEQRRRGAHPRMGGENVVVCLPPSATAGSSPHGRGKRSLRGGQTLRSGLIPARAGKTTAWCALDNPAWAHPRMGGENVTRYMCDSMLAGSSPHGRGKPLGIVDNRPRFGRIPAWAGKTRSTISEAWSSPAHPRAGGENRSVRSGRTHSGGSSPHGRGKRPTTSHQLEHMGAHPRMGEENYPACSIW